MMKGYKSKPIYQIKTANLLRQFSKNKLDIVNSSTLLNPIILMLYFLIFN
jgi:hypothetical protein